MKVWPVSARVNSPKNNDAEIIVPVEIEAAESVSGGAFFRVKRRSVEFV
jgi:hypothetical protein